MGRCLAENKDMNDKVFRTINCILFRKLFQPTLRKNCSSTSQSVYVLKSTELDGVKIAALLHPNIM